jgi:hypothetical protein
MSIATARLRFKYRTKLRRSDMGLPGRRHDPKNAGTRAAAMPLPWSLADPLRRVTINMALLTELSLLPPRTTPWR